MTLAGSVGLSHHPNQLLSRRSQVATATRAVRDWAGGEPLPSPLCAPRHVIAPWRRISLSPAQQPLATGQQGLEAARFAVHEIHTNHHPHLSSLVIQLRHRPGMLLNSGRLPANSDQSAEDSDAVRQACVEATATSIPSCWPSPNIPSS